MRQEGSDGLIYLESVMDTNKLMYTRTHDPVKSVVLKPRKKEDYPLTSAEPQAHIIMLPAEKTDYSVDSRIPHASGYPRFYHRSKRCNALKRERKCTCTE